MGKWTKGPYTFEQCTRLDGTTVQEWTIEAPGRGDDDEPTIIAGVFTSKRDAALLTAAYDLAEAAAALVARMGPDDMSGNTMTFVLHSEIRALAAALKKAKGDAP